MNSLMQKGT